LSHISFRFRGSSLGELEVFCEAYLSAEVELSAAEIEDGGPVFRFARESRVG
jgi:hypothetical protein